MVPSFRERKPHGAARTAVPSFVLHPVVSGGTARLVTHRPAENPASTIAHEDPTVVPAGDTTQSHRMEGPGPRPRHAAGELPVTPVPRGRVRWGGGRACKGTKMGLSPNVRFRFSSPGIEPCRTFEEHRRWSFRFCFIFFWRQSFLVFDIRKWNPHTGRFLLLIRLLEPHMMMQMKPVLPETAWVCAPRLSKWPRGEEWPEELGHLLGDAQGSDLGRVCVVLPVKGRVHSQLTPEHQLPFPPVPWGGKVRRVTDKVRGASVC